MRTTLYLTMLPGLVLLALLAVQPACQNPNYCGDHENNDCRLSKLTEYECESNDQCSMNENKVCSLESLTCVQCTVDSKDACSAAEPACRGNVCSLCEQHVECSDSAACLPDGSCAAKADVAYVSATGTANMQCSKEMPCDKISRAVGLKRRYVKVSGQIDEALDLNNENATILADPDAKIIRRTAGPIVTIRGTSNVEIYRLAIAGTNAIANTGLSLADSAKVTLSGVIISGNMQTGISTTGGSLVLTRSIVSENRGGGVLVGEGGGFNITNNFIIRNGTTGGTNNVGGVKLDATEVGTNRFEFNTVADNHVRSAGGTVGGFYCDIDGFSVANNLFVRNAVGGDVNAANANLFVPGRCDYEPTIVGSDVAVLKFKSPNTSPYDYHLTDGSSAIGQAADASSQANEVNIDFDGEKRDASGRDLGADEYKKPAASP